MNTKAEHTCTEHTCTKLPSQPAILQTALVVELHIGQVVEIVRQTPPFLSY